MNQVIHFLGDSSGVVAGVVPGLDPGDDSSDQSNTFIVRDNGTAF